MAAKPKRYNQAAGQGLTCSRSLASTARASASSLPAPAAGRQDFVVTSTNKRRSASRSCVQGSSEHNDAVKGRGA